MNSRQTFSQNASFLPPLHIIQCISPCASPHTHTRSPSLCPLHQPNSLCITICLTPTPLFSPIPPPSVHYLCSRPPQSSGHWPTWWGFDDGSHQGRTTSTCAASASLNYPVICAAVGAVYQMGPCRLCPPTRHSSRRFRGVILLFISLPVSPVCQGVSHPAVHPLHLNIATHCIICNRSSTRQLMPPPPPPLIPLLPGLRLCTWEGDVESLERYGEVRNEAQLGLEVAVKAGVDGCRPLRAGESRQRLCKAAIFCYQEVVVVILQVEGMESELDTLKRESRASDKNSVFTPLNILTKADGFLWFEVQYTTPNQITRFLRWLLVFFILFLFKTFILHWSTNCRLVHTGHSLSIVKI